MANKRQDLKFFRFFARKVKRETHVHLLCRVVSVESDHTCTVQPQDLASDGDKRGMILSVRIPKHARDEIKVGISVGVGFFDRDVSAVDVGDAGDIANASDRQHSLNDAFIEAVF
ncbi:hypothetical protein [Levilactobacillus brevis]|uniref:hypothetical protein n=2 Tax=Levilactobacillus brevis TaxID=1580 RepID=UPI0021A3782C|nr:hypothetical protein [Levilactobacillus brevis]MCT3570471.1 hypothetical protein [Levilactobacillus brevis]MCT3579726.1 hypothetical protein [Levilactobacillus brevis]MCT3597557.1 hypothetical protein [Levilactobacillus brevis]